MFLISNSCNCCYSTSSNWWLCLGNNPWLFSFLVPLDFFLSFVFSVGKNKRASKNSLGHFKDLFETHRVDSILLPKIVKARFVWGFPDPFILFWITDAEKYNLVYHIELCGQMTIKEDRYSRKCKWKMFLFIREFSREKNGVAWSNIIDILTGFLVIKPYSFLSHNNILLIHAICMLIEYIANSSLYMHHVVIRSKIKIISRPIVLIT